MILPPQQLEFERLLAAVKAAPGPRRQRRAIKLIPSADFPARLNRVLLSENVAFGTYALMLAVHNAGGRISRAKLSLETGSTYQAICHQTRRTPWFADDHSGPLVAVVLNHDGKGKLDRIHHKLAHDY